MNASIRLQFNDSIRIPALRKHLCRRSAVAYRYYGTHAQGRVWHRVDNFIKYKCTFPLGLLGVAIARCLAAEVLLNLSFGSSGTIFTH